MTSERVLLIRRGNELINKKDYKNALKIFLSLDYKEGIGRIASIMEHEQKDMPAALKLYKRAGMYSNVDKIAMDMAQAVRFLIQEDKSQAQEPHSAAEKTEALIKAREKLGIKDERIARFHQQDINMWRPEVISKDDLDKFKNK